MSMISAQRDLRRYDGIQLLRFIASGIVLVAHATIYTHQRLAPGIPIWELGGSGVDIFFVISGFVIVLAARGKQPHSWVDWRSFLAKRALRIFPMYWAATTVNLAILLTVPALVIGSSFHLDDVVKWYLLIPTRSDNGRIEPLLGVGWTLYFETFFYAMFTVSLKLRRSPLLFVPPVLIAVFIVGLFKTPNWPAWTIYCDPRVLEFLVGMAIARGTELFRTPPAVGAPMVAAGAILLYLGGVSGGWSEMIARTMASGLMVAGFVGLEPVLRGRVGRLSMFLGAASYALYLTHPLFAPAVPAVLAKLHLQWPLLSIFGCIAVSIAIASIAHLFFEAPLMVAGSAWLKRRGADISRDRQVAPELSTPTP